MQGVHKLDGFSSWWCDAAAAIEEQTVRRLFLLKSSEEEKMFWRLSSIFGAARKDGPGWIRLVILIGWKYAATLTVKLKYAPNKNTNFFLLQD